MSTWVLVADRARARLFGLHRGGRGLDEIGDFLNAEGRAAGRELSGERPPRTHDRFGPGRHAIEPQTTQREKTAEHFARQLDAVLEHGRVDHQYEDLVLIAPAQFLGTLTAALDDQVRARVVAEIPRDLTTAEPERIFDYLPVRLHGRPPGPGPHA